MTIPNVLVDDAMVFPIVSRIPDLMLILVNPSLVLLVKFQATMDSNWNSTTKGFI